MVTTRQVCSAKGERNWDIALIHLIKPPQTWPPTILHPWLMISREAGGVGEGTGNIKLSSCWDQYKADLILRQFN